MLHRACGSSLRVMIGILAIALAILVAMGTAAPAASASAQQSGQQPLVEKFVLDDTIQPITADELSRAIERAQSAGAQALLIQMDTPGGLVESMRSMAGAILS